MTASNKYARRNSPLSERLAFYTAVDPRSGCHLWTAGKNSSGYGQLWWKGREALAHRMAWRVAKGPIPHGQQVLHECDVRHCINPGHLFLGANADNVADRDRKGRHVPLLGSAHGMAILTEEDVRAIRASSARGIDLAKQFGVYPSRISAIRLRQSWKHI